MEQSTRSVVGISGRKDGEDVNWIGSDFRTYLHDPKAVESCLKAQGLAKYFEACTFLWLTQVFAYAERG
jgi:hypothetical protein